MTARRRRRWMGPGGRNVGDQGAWVVPDDRSLVAGGKNGREGRSTEASSPEKRMNSPLTSRDHPQWTDDGYPH